jgi:hypothetical protein
MRKKRMDFPMEVKKGSVTVRIYKVRNKAFKVTKKDGKVEQQERFSFMVVHHVKGKRFQKMFADFAEALADAKKKAEIVDNEELDALHLDAADVRAYVSSMNDLGTDPTRFRFQCPRVIVSN